MPQPSNQIQSWPGQGKDVKPVKLAERSNADLHPVTSSSCFLRAGKPQKTDYAKKGKTSG